MLTTPLLEMAILTFTTVSVALLLITSSTESDFSLKVASVITLFSTTSLLWLVALVTVMNEDLLITL